MNKKAEKDRRNQIKRTIKQKERNELLEALPVSLPILQNCFEFLNTKLTELGCNDTLKFTLEFTDQNDLPQNELISWLKENGGYCDCEVLANVESKINDE